MGLRRILNDASRDQYGILQNVNTECRREERREEWERGREESPAHEGSGWTVLRQEVPGKHVRAGETRRKHDGGLVHSDASDLDSTHCREAEPTSGGRVRRKRRREKSSRGRCKIRVRSLTLKRSVALSASWRGRGPRGRSPSVRGSRAFV